MPTTATTLTAWFGNSRTPTVNGVFDQTDPLLGPATSAPLTLATDHIGVTPTATTTAAGTPVAFSATRYDAANHALSAVTSAITFTIAPQASGAKNGAACTGSSCTATAVGTYTVTGSYAGKTATSVLTVTAAAAATVVVVSGTPQTAVTGSGFPAPLVARVLDTYGNPVRAVPVTFALATSSTTGTAAFPGGALSVVITSDAGGTAGTAARADLGVSIAAPSSVAAGGRLSVTITVTNRGPATATRLGVMLLLPPASRSPPPAAARSSGGELCCSPHRAWRPVRGSPSH